MSKNFAEGTKFGSGACNVIGSQSSSCKILIARSQIDSDMTLHSYEPGAPPKVRRKAMMANLSSDNGVQV